jgi:hypothetical protein
MDKKIKPPKFAGGSRLIGLPRLRQELLFDQILTMGLKPGDRIISRWPASKESGLRWIDYRLTLKGYRSKIIPLWLTEQRSDIHPTWVETTEIAWCDLRNCNWWKIIP